MELSGVKTGSDIQHNKQKMALQEAQMRQAALQTQKNQFEGEE
jgi:hypothetical protein